MTSVAMLLDDRLSPTTTRIGFLRLTLPQAAHGLAAWLRTLYPQVTVTEVSGDLESLVHRLEPLVLGAAPKDLLLRTRGEWTAYLDNSALGTDPIGLIGYLSEELRCDGLAIDAQPHQPPRRNGGMQFELFGPERGEFLNTVRAVSVTADGNKWRFVAFGEVQPFERTEAYAARRIRDRFTVDMLAEYCAALGIRPFDEDFYDGSGVLVDSKMPLPRGIQTMTLTEARRRLGID